MPGGSAETLLKVDAVSYAYGDLVAVWDISLEARAGRVVAIVGRNGAGKTTLLSGLAGLLPTVAGSVKLCGIDVSRASAWQRARQGLCLVPEGKRVFRDLTVEENLAVGIPGGTRRRERRLAVANLLERFPILDEKRRQLAGSCSGGQQQLLAIASALTMRPRVLLVDEPSSGLSPIAVDQVLQTLQELTNDGLAVVIVEQLVEQVITTIADEVVVVEQGRVVLRDAPERISLAELEHRIYVA